jgi:Flp pilus assembly protein TadG
VIARRLAHDRRGAAAMEFALVAPVLCLVFAGIVDLGNMVYTRMRVRDALNTGAQHALVQAQDLTAAKGAQLAADVARIVRNAGGAPFSDATVLLNNGPTATDTAEGARTSGSAAAVEQCYCPGVSYKATPPYTKTFTYGAAVACNSACTDGGKAAKFIRITAARAYTPLFAGYGIVEAGTISYTAEVQVG